MDDEKIIMLFEIRNEDAISETDKKYGAYCTAVAKNILSNDEEASECINDTYLSLWNSIPPQKPKNLRAYTAKICRNTALNMLRAKNTEKRGGGEFNAVLEEISDFVSGSENPEKTFEEREMIGEINLFLKNLTKEKRSIFILRYWYFESLSDIANRTGKTENSIRNTLFRIREKLKKHLEERGFEL